MERGKIGRPPIPYIPPEDPIQESVEKKSGSKRFKVTLPDGTIVYHKVYDSDLNEAFVIHVKEVLSLVKRKNYYIYYEGAVLKKEDCQKRFDTAQKKSDSSIANPTKTVERAKALEKSLELAIQAVMEAKVHRGKRGKSFFGFYKTMLGEKAQVEWARIVILKWESCPGRIYKVMCTKLFVSIPQIPLGTVLSFTYCPFLLMTRRSTKITILVTFLKSIGRFY